MRIGLEIEQIRQELGLSVVFMCNAMDLTTGEYQKLLCGRYRLNIFQLIGVIGATCRPLPLDEHQSLLAPCHNREQRADSREQWVAPLAHRRDRESNVFIPSYRRPGPAELINSVGGTRPVSIAPQGLYIGLLCYARNDKFLSFLFLN